jgi:hypothetical protein
MTDARADRAMRWVRRATTLLVLAGVWGFLLGYFKAGTAGSGAATRSLWTFLIDYVRPDLILLDTYPAGGDTPSFVHPVEHLRDVLLPAGNPQGWDLGNFAGYAPYQFYFLPPSLMMIAMEAVGVPLNVAFKLVSVAGTFLLPLASLITVRSLGYRFPIPALGATVTLIFLFNEGNSMWGGNIPSTLAGEFSFGLSFGLAVLFFGLLYRGVETQRGWRTQAAVLALTGLCHPVGFINAVTPGLFFLLDRRNLARNLRYLIVVYGTATLLMGFWLFPVVAKVGYSTSINWTWHFQSWREPLPHMLVPVGILALLDALWVLARPSPANRPARYMLFGVLITVVTFYNATAAGLPEIRFAPFAQFLLVLLALDFVARILLWIVDWSVAAPSGRRVPAWYRATVTILPALGVIGAVVAWVEVNTTFIPAWIKWNYEGIEKKPTWPILQTLTNHLRGPISAPRVAYENSPQYERFGSMRIWESLPHFSGRATLEGLLLQTPVTSPFVYYIQSEISLQGTGVIPGYPYPAVNPQRGTLRLDLFNARDLITITPTVKDALAKDARWERTLDLPPYAIFTRRGGDPHYVRVPHFRPVLVHTSKRWKKDFHRWFSSDSALSVPIVAASDVPAAERALFRLESHSPTELPHEAIEADCRIEEKIDHLAIEFTTTCPGLPHVVAVSYYPNWHVEGARRVYLTSPAFMLVFPDGPHVRLLFRRNAIDWIGIAASLLGLAICLAPVRRPLLVPSEGLSRGLTASQPWLVASVAIVVLGVTGWHVLKNVGPPHYYQLGWKAFEKADYPTAIASFERVILLGDETTTAADGTFFRAASLLRSNRPAEALRGYRDVIVRHPDSIWVAEAHYHVGLCLQQLKRVREAKASFRYVTVAYPGNRWAGFAADRLREIRAAGGARG